MRKIKIGDCYKGDYQPVLVVDADHPFADGCFLVSDLAERSAYMTVDEIAKRESLPTLHLPIGNDAKKYGGAWFDLILSGEKTEEYREVKESYVSRFCDLFSGYVSVFGSVSNLDVKEWKPWRVLHLTNGYGHDKPQLWAHIQEITIGKGKPEWGAPTDRDVFIIRLGKVFHTKNLKA